MYLIIKYPKPISFWKTSKKLLHSKNKKALFKSIISIKNNILPQSFKPLELNKILASWISNDISHFSYAKESFKISKSKIQSVTSSGLHDNVLVELKKIGIENIEGKKI